MTKTSRLSNALKTSFGLLLAVSAAGPDCCAQEIFFDGGTPPGPGTDWHSAVNWSNDMVPNAAGFYLIQDNRTAIFSSGSTSVRELTVSHDSFGQLRMTDGSLTITNPDAPLEVGRERFPKGKQGDYNNNGIVDAADYVIWRKTFGQSVLNPGDGADGDESETIDQGDYDFWRARFGLLTKGGNVVMTGSSTLTTNGAVIGRRSKGALSVGPMALFESKGTGPNPFSTDVNTQPLEVGGYGPAYTAITSEPGLEGDGLVIVEGTVNANSLIINTFGSKGEVRVLPGGRVHLNGALELSRCDTQFFPSGCGLVANPQPLMSSKLSIIGSGGTFEVGRFDPDLSPPPGHDPLHRRDIRSGFPADATISFTADAGGVTPIVLVDNSIAFPGELTGTAYLDGTVGNVPGTYAGMNLELNLDAYLGTSPLTLIDAPPDLPGASPAHLVGVFGTVTFLGSRTATVNYDYLNGNVFLSNFQNGAGAGSLAGNAVPEPSGLTMMSLTLGLLLCSHSMRGDGLRISFTFRVGGKDGVEVL
jgi:hypothetical protein